MRGLAAALILTAFLVALQIGQLQFTDVTSAQEFSQALRDGPVLIYIHQPNCKGCNDLKTQVFDQEQVANALKGVNLISIDLAKFLIRSVDVVADGQVYIYSNDVLRAQKASGKQSVPVIGTPTIIMGFVKNGTIHATLIMIGAAPADTFVKLVEMAYAAPETAAQTAQPVKPSVSPGLFLQIIASFAAGVASVFSPCVLPVLTIAATTYLTRRKFSLVLAGMALSFSLIATVVAAVASWAGEVANTVLYAVGGAVLIAMGSILTVERLNRAFVMWASRFQTSAYKASKISVGAVGDLALGASLGAVWTPCIAPFFGAVVVANLITAAVTGNYLALFFATLAYAAGLAVMIYALIALVRKGAAKAAKSIKWSRWGRRAEYAVGILSLVLGVLLLGEALGLGTFSTVFKI